MGRVDGKVVLVTGAARGMGRSHALKLAAEGADLILVDICAPVEPVPYPMSGKDDLDETAAAVSALGRRVAAAAIDVRDGARLAEFTAEAVATLGGLDAAVANA